MTSSARSSVWSAASRMESSAPTWRLIVDRKVKRQVRDCFLDEAQRAAVWRRILTLAHDPFYRALQQPWNWRAWRIHLGDTFKPEGHPGWRAVYTVNRTTRTVIVIRVAPHSEAYNAKPKRYRLGNPWMRV